MKIETIKSNTAFSGYMLAKHINWLSRVNPRHAENYMQQHGINAHFQNNSIVSGLNIYTVKIMRKLGLPLPEHIFVAKIPQKESAYAYSFFSKDRKPHRIFKHLSVIFDKKTFFVPPKKLNKTMNINQRDFGTTHFLNIPIHEYMHCVLFRKIYEKMKYWHANWDNIIHNKFSKIDITPFRKEIAQKIGTAVNNDAVELHAIYWAKEICKSLNSNLVPRYNPFKHPKIKLSPLLREFITKISQADYNGAKEVSKHAKLLNKR